ncbi:diguanylate cyclase [Colwellia sp. MSW7]|uniref:diguanylate cyclase n=1 Tax=Colwellia maritima TaxID=2912588 RepID=A0ABS9X6I2_9GAMM|nr:diguanylate cyclase [Colwellia maritima]MCI2285843.1 diguanylate cyclase [Colwellia maritima]
MCCAGWGRIFIYFARNTCRKCLPLAEKIQRNVQNNFVDFEGESISVTVSMGIEQSNGNRTIDEIVNSADKYLYQAKNSGRNKIYPKY